MKRIICSSWLAIFFLFSASTQALWLDDCNKDLGMESGAIPHESITASSLHADVVGPHMARVRVDNRGGAWCPKGQMQNNSREYLEIDLGRVVVLNATGSQGRFGNGGGVEYTELYKLEYWRPGFDHFVNYVNASGCDTLVGNSNTYLEVLNILNPPIIASKIRFVPFITHPRTICLRVELYGCNHTTGLLNYTMEDGTKGLSGLDLQDKVYDGSKSARGILRNGLGQLYDGRIGQTLIKNSEFKLADENLGKGWVGWSKNLLKNSPLEIIFHFNTMRNFSAFVFHTFQAPGHHIVLPTKAEIFFGEDEENYHTKPLIATFKAYSSSSNASNINISVSLDNRPGQVLKILFYLPTGYFVISEVNFESEPCVCNLSDWSPNKASAPAERTADREEPRDGTTISAVHSNPHTYMGIVIGFIVGVFLLVASGLFVYVRKLRKKKSSPHVLKSQLSDTANLAFDMRSLRLTNNYSVAGASMYGPDEDGSMYHEPYKTPLFSSSDYSVATIGRQFNEYSEGLTPGSSRKSPNNGGGDYAVPILSTPPPPFNTSNNTPFGTKNNTPFNTNANTPYNTNTNTPYNTTPISAPTTPFSPIPGTPHSTSLQQFTSNVGSTANGTLPSNATFPSLVRLCSPPPLPVPPPLEKFQPPSAQIAKDLNILSPFGTALYHLDGSTTFRSRNPRELPRQAVHLAEKLGDGQFGTVYIGEVFTPSDNGTNDNNTGTLTTNNVGRKVVVASLLQDAPAAQREISWKHAQVLATLQDPNIECLLGVVSRDDPLLLVMEYPALGDLNLYLRRHVPDTTTPRLNHMRAISYGSLIYLATQIASGMKYLENLNIIHKDLATRNVLVAPGQLVKIGSIGSCRSLYAGDYYRCSSEGSSSTLIPLRWMSWEALFLGELTGKSDVWAFGVTLWEMLTLARQQPFESLSDDGVIESLYNFYQNENNKKIHLLQPAACPKEIYDLLLECWRKSPDERPNFRDIHMFLQRKNHGYAPDL